METQVSAWNAGNVDNFMQGDWNNESLMVRGKSGITNGWQQTLANYKKHYTETA